MDSDYPGGFAALTITESARPPHGQSRGTRVVICGKSIGQYDHDEGRFLGFRADLDGEHATLLTWLDDGRWELLLERNAERLLLLPDMLRPIEGALHVGAEVTVRALSTDAKLNGESATVLHWNEAKDRWAVRVGERDVLAKASNLQLRPRRRWTAMSLQAIRGCTDPPLRVPCDQLLAHNATLPREFFAFNEGDRTVYVRYRSGERSLYPPTTADGPARGHEPRIPSGFCDENGRFVICGDLRCHVCTTR